MLYYIKPTTLRSVLAEQTLHARQYYSTAPLHILFLRFCEVNTVGESIAEPIISSYEVQYGFHRIIIN